MTLSYLTIVSIDASKQAQALKICRGLKETRTLWNSHKVARSKTMIGDNIYHVDVFSGGKSKNTFLPKCFLRIGFENASVVPLTLKFTIYRRNKYS